MAYSSFSVDTFSNSSSTISHGIPLPPCNFMSEGNVEYQNGRKTDPDVLMNLGDVGGAIVYIREAMAMNQAELAEKLEIGRPALSMIENNKRTPSLGTLSKIASALGNVPIHAIFLKASALVNPGDLSAAKVADAIISMHVEIFNAKESKSEVSKMKIENLEKSLKHSEN